MNEAMSKEMNGSRRRLFTTLPSEANLPPVAAVPDLSATLTFTDALRGSDPIFIKQKPAAPIPTSNP